LWCGSHRVQRQRNYGRHHAQEIAFTLKGDAAAHPAGKLLSFEMEIDLPEGDVYL
jgi:hypothetical protein